MGLSLIDADQIVATYRFAPAPGWTARDVVVASDNQARILFVDADGRMALWSVHNSGKVTNSGTVYGPPVSGQSAIRVSAGADGLTRVLWTGFGGDGDCVANGPRQRLSVCGSFGESSWCGDWDY